MGRVCAQPGTVPTTLGDKKFDLPPTTGNHGLVRFCFGLTLSISIEVDGVATVVRTVQISMRSYRDLAESQQIPSRFGRISSRIGWILTDPIETWLDLKGCR